MVVRRGSVLKQTTIVASRVRYRDIGEIIFCIVNLSDFKRQLFSANKKLILETFLIPPHLRAPYRQFGMFFDDGFMSLVIFSGQFGFLLR